MRASPNPAALVPLGVITGAHGVRGEVRVKLHNPRSDLLLSTDEAVLRAPDGSTRPIALRGARPHGALLRVELAGVADRDAAAALRGSELCLPRERLPALPEGEYYLIDLIGLTARLPDGRELGRVVDTLEYPASQVLCVETAEHILEIPMLEPYLGEVRLDRGEVIVDHVEDLEPYARNR